MIYHFGKSRSIGFLHITILVLDALASRPYQFGISNPDWTRGNARRQGNKAQEAKEG